MPNTGSRIYLSIIGLLLALAGGIFAWLMWMSFSRARAVDSWPTVPCVILESKVSERQVDPNRPVEFRFEVLYSYEWDGKEYQSERYRLRGSSWTARKDEVEMLVSQYPAAAVKECRVNPDAAAEAVLVGESKAPGYSIWFPAIFVVGGLGVVVGAWRK